ELGEPLRAVQDDERHVAERLDVVDRRRTVVEALHGGKRRLEARLGALAFERLDERGLFAGFVGARTTVHVDVAVEAAAEDVLAEEPGLVGLLDLRLENLLDVEELAADVDVGDLRANRVARNRAALDQQ